MTYLGVITKSFLLLLLVVTNDLHAQSIKKRAFPGEKKRIEIISANAIKRTKPLKRGAPSKFTAYFEDSKQRLNIFICQRKSRCLNPQNKAFRTAYPEFRPGSFLMVEGRFFSAKSFYATKVTLSVPKTATPKNGPINVPKVDQPPVISSPTPTATPTKVPTPLPKFTRALNETDASRFLHQATFGPKLSEIEALLKIDYDQWFQDQVKAPRCDVSGIVWAENQGYVRVNEVYQAWWECVRSGKDLLRQRVTFALSEIFVISVSGGRLSNFPISAATYHDLLAKNAFGNFRDLLEAVSKSPEMATFLSFLKNEKEQPAINRFPDENYAREIMQLFTIGLNTLNLDGSIKLSEFKEPIPTYDQSVVTELAKVFTGWTWPKNQYSLPGWDNVTAIWGQPLIPYEEYHSRSTKRILNNLMIPAELDANEDMDAALDIIFKHPNVAPFITHQLIQRLVTSNPSPQYIRRVATIFENNGLGVRGDLLATVKAILLDPEARDPHTFANLETYGHLREPVVVVGNLIRGIGITLDTKYWKYPNLAPSTGDNGLGQGPYLAPSVFNFFTPDYAPAGEIRNRGLVSPEFFLMNQISSLARPNYLSDLINKNMANVFLDYEDEIVLSGDPIKLVKHLNKVIASNALSPSDEQSLATLIARIPQQEGKNRTSRALQMIVLSPDYMIQK
jgi:uncharacterized protein (DUF1800 family)